MVEAMTDRYLPPNMARATLAIIPIILAACSSTPSPVAEMSAAQTAVTAAEQADAAQHAPGDLDRARDKLARAQTAMQGDEIEEARRLAEQALADARLAEAKSRADAARQDADKVQAGMNEMQAGPGNSTPRPLVLQ
jgi:Domain of unknown function (DUF4398)